MQLPNGAKNLFGATQNYPTGFKFQLQDMEFGKQKWFTYIRGHGPKVGGTAEYLSHKMWTLRVELCEVFNCPAGTAIWRLAKDGAWVKAENLVGAVAEAFEDSTHIPIAMPAERPVWTNPGCKFFEGGN